MTSQEIRASFLKYFERHGHTVVASSPLVPHDDPTLLFTNAGMNQFKDTFLGRDRRAYSRATTAQKCMRVSGKHNDLENVGPSFRHHTFFEMLGNFSFGDYFKKDAIPLAWSLLTEEWKLPKDRLFATIFKGDAAVPRDAEAHDIWRHFLPAERIGELGADDNFWSMGDTGPCGRCSEIYFFRGNHLPCGAEAAGQRCRALECDCDRFVEIWNNVFMEFDRQADGTLNPLPAPSIDTGMGLERVTAVIQGHLSNYDTDAFTPLLAAIGSRAGRTHGGTMEPADISMRVIADHMRAMTFLIADGVVPSNEGRGYVLRKIMRRAMRHGKKLGFEQPLLHTLVDTVAEQFGPAYPELVASRSRIAQLIRAEEERFDAVLTNGLPRLEQLLDRAAAEGGVVPGDAAFRLYDTHGIPQDFIEDTIDSRKLTLDREGFERAMDEQREKARAKSTFKSGAAQDAPWTAPDELRASLERVGDAVFRGYDATSTSTPLLAVFDERRQSVDSLAAGEQGFVALAETPFYLEAGGQVSDVGTITAPHGQAQVTGVLRAGSWPRLHAVKVTSGVLTPRDLVTAEVTSAVRDATRRHHTATHLLHAALRQVLGRHVHQKGSLVAPDRLRFDFVHHTAVTPEQQLEIERIVNAQIMRNTPVTTEIRSTQEAIAAGATALFGEKYGDTVRVVSVPGFSTELCGGTHVRATGDIGLFVIESEGGVAAGVRRIEALTGDAALTYLQNLRSSLAETVTKWEADKKRLTKELQQARTKAAMGSAAATGAADDTIDLNGIKLVAREVAGLDKDGLRALVDQQRDRIKSGVVVIAAPSEGKVTIVVGVTPDLTTKLPAGQIVKQLAPIVGGGGGGRPDFAEAGGKDISKIGELLSASRVLLEKMLK